MGGCGLDSYGSERGPVADHCEHGVCWLFEGFCFMVLVVTIIFNSSSSLKYTFFLFSYQSVSSPPSAGHILGRCNTCMLLIAAASMCHLRWWMNADIRSSLSASCSWITQKLCLTESVSLFHNAEKVCTYFQFLWASTDNRGPARQGDYRYCMWRSPFSSHHLSSRCLHLGKGSIWETWTWGQWGPTQTKTGW